MRRLTIMVVAVMVLMATEAYAQALVEWQAETRTYTVVVTFSDFMLRVYDPDGKEIFSSLVALPRHTPALPVRGTCVAIQRNPWWYPTAKTKEYFRRVEHKLLPDRVPPGPDNEMGSVKIISHFTTPGANSLSRIHGTLRPHTIGTRASSGCIRMRNADANALADVLEPLLASGMKIRVWYVETVQY